jgi:hypothetical protein
MLSRYRAYKRATSCGIKWECCAASCTVGKSGLASLRLREAGERIPVSPLAEVLLLIVMCASPFFCRSTSNLASSFSKPRYRSLSAFGLSRPSSYVGSLRMSGICFN